MSQSDGPGEKRPQSKPAEVLPHSEGSLEEIREILREHGIEDPDRYLETATIQAITASKAFYGPIPPAEMLAEYDQVRPGLANEIISWTQQQQAHRRGLELMVTRGSETRMNRAQIAAMVVAALSLVAATILGIYGNPWTAAVVVIVGIGGPNAATILARMLGRSPDHKAPHPPVSDSD